jgi:ElaB/YqjD/DUF883 family membrane-anchored ribosome-binding protein
MEANTKTAAEIQENLTFIETRLRETNEALETAENGAQEAVKSVAKNNEPEDFEELFVAENRIATLKRVLTELQNQYSALALELAETSETENRVVVLLELKSLADLANKDLAAYYDERKQFAAAIRRHAEKLVELSASRFSLQGEFIALAASITPGFNQSTSCPENVQGIVRLQNELKGIELEGIRQNWSGRKRSVIDENSLPPRVEFFEEIGNIENFIYRERNRAAREESPE